MIPPENKGIQWSILVRFAELNMKLLRFLDLDLFEFQEPSFFLIVQTCEALVSYEPFIFDANTFLHILETFFFFIL